MNHVKALLAIFALTVLFGARAAYADWPCIADSTLPIVVAPGNQWNVHLVSDGKGGAIASWQDRRAGTSDKIFLQRLSATGEPLWSLNGIPLAATGGFQYYPQMISDGQGGVFIVWQDNRSSLDYDIYIQRVSRDGIPLWTPNGVVVCNAANHQYNPQIASDGLGNVVVVWQDRRSGEFDVYAQKFDGTGSALWSPNGRPVCTETGDQMEPHIVADDGLGSVFSWSDYRAGSGFSDIYAQRLDPAGSQVWDAEGVPVCTAPNSQFSVTMAGDNAGGAIIAWQDRRNGSYDNVYAQRVNANGMTLWTGNGVALGAVSGQQYYPQIAGDGHAGAVIVWQDNRKGSDYDIYAQAIDQKGHLLWPAAGQPVCTAAGHQYNPQLVLQRTSALITWQDKRNGDFDIYGQRLFPDGSPRWDANGVPFARLPLDQFAPVLASDSLEGAMVAWSDYHLASGSTDVYAQRIGANGKLAGGCYRTFIQDSLGKRPVSLRRSRLYRMPNAGTVLDSVFGRGLFTQGLYVGIPRTDSAKRYAWEFFSKAYYVRRVFPQIGEARPFDRVFDKPLVGQLKNPSPFRYNNSLAGELLALKINIAASDAGITDGGFGDLIYKDTLGALNPMNGRSLRSVTTYLDSAMTLWRRLNPSPRPNFYLTLSLALRKVNRAFYGTVDTFSTSPLRIKPVRAALTVPFLYPNPDPAPPLPRYQADPVYSAEIPEKFSLSQNYPNPFNPLTTIEFTLPEPAEVTLTIFDILGRQISALIDHVPMDDGHQIVDFDASNLASGVYFYQVIAQPLRDAAPIRSHVMKMMILK